MGKIENVAGNLGNQLARGQLDLSNMDIGAIGQGLLSDLSPEELSGFEGNLPEIYESLSQVASSLGAGQGAGVDVGALMQQLSQQTGESSKVDMTKVLQQISSQMSPNTSGQVDVATMLQTMGPLLGALKTPSASPFVSPETESPRKRKGPRRRNAKNH